MPQFDYNIANSIRPIQLESPMNQLAQAYQLKGAQQGIEMNALRMQDAQRAAAEDEKIRQLYAQEGADYTSPNFMRQISAISPTRGIALGKNLREMQTEEAKARKEAADALDKQLNNFRAVVPQINSEEGVAQYLKAMYEHPFIGKLAKSTIPYEQSLEANLKAFRENPDQWKLNSSGVTGEKILEATLKVQKQREEQKRREYSDYVYQTLDQGGEPVPFAQFAAPTAAPTAAPIAAPQANVTDEIPPADAERITALMTDGEKVLPTTAVGSGKRIGIPGMDPYAAMLYNTGDPRHKEMADALQKQFAEKQKVPTDIQELERYMKMSPAEKASYEKLQKLRGTNVNVSTGQLEKAEQVKKGEFNVGQYKEIAEKNRANTKLLPALDVAERILTKGFETGFGTDAKVAGARILSALGVPDATKYASDAATLNAMLSQTVLQRQLEQKGVATEGDAQRIADTSAKLTNPVDANKYILSVARATIQRDKEEKQFYDNWWSKNKTYEGADAAWEAGPANKSIFTYPALKAYAPKTTAPSAPVKALPKPGDIRDGYAYKGGDPGSQTSWEKAGK